MNNNKKKAILIFASYIPSKSMSALKNSGIDTFYLLPTNLAEIIDNIKFNSVLSDEEIKKQLEPVFCWIKNIVKRKKNDYILVIENFSIRINYHLYDFVKRNKLTLEEDIN